MFIALLGWSLDGRMRMLVTHAGRDSLIDRGRMRGEPPRSFEGVLYAALATFQTWDIGPHRVEAHAFFSLSPSAFLHPYDHPQYGASNRALFAYINGRWGMRAAYEVDMPRPETGRGVAVSVPDIFIAQAKELHLFGARCYPSIPADGPYPHTRHPAKEIRGNRYLVVLKNHYQGPEWGQY